jgi:predicted outer membrane protein
VQSLEVMRTNLLSRAARVTGGWVTMIFIVASAASCSPNGFAAASESDTDDALSTDRGPHAATRSEQNAGATVQGVATFTAADVARIVLVLEQSSVAQARLAEERATTMEVKTYAARIVRERTEARDRLVRILERLTPRSNDATPPLFEKEIAKSQEWLLSQESAFDLPFMTAEVGSHARILGMLEASLLPSASQATVRPGTDGVARELEEELVTLRAQTAAQMVHALRVQGVLRAGNAPVDDAVMTAGGTTLGENAGGGPNLPR